MRGSRLFAPAGTVGFSGAWAAVLALLLAAAPAAAAPLESPAVSPELAFGPPVEGPAPVIPAHPSGLYGRYKAAAFDGAAYLAAWTTGEPDRDEPIYATRVLADGTVPDPLGFALGTGHHPQIAFDGERFLVLFSARSDVDATPTVRAVRVTSAGEVLDPGGLVVPLGPKPLREIALASDGDALLIVGETFYEPGGSARELRASRFAPNGEANPSGSAVVASFSQGGSADVAFGGAGYLVVWQQGEGREGGEIRAARVSLAGEVLDPGGFLVDTVPVFPWTPSGPRVAFDGANYHVAWSGQEGLWTRRVTPQGTLADPASALIQPDLDDLSEPVLDDAAFDGEHVRVLWSRIPDFSSALAGLPAYLHVSRLSAAGGAVHGEGPTQVSPQAQNGALAERGALVIWQNDRPDGFRNGLHGARLGSDGTLLDAPPLLLGRGTNAQSEPQVSSDGRQFVVTWLDDRGRAVGESDALFAARVAADGRVVDEGGTRIANAAANWDLVSHGSSLLSVGISGFGEDDHADVFGTRLSPALEILSPEPLDLGSAALYRGLAVTPDPAGFALLSDGSMVRVSHAGEVRRTALSDGLGPMVDELRAVGFDGTQRLLVWSPGALSPGIRATRLGPGDEILDPGGIALVDLASTFRVTELAVAHGAGMYVVAWRGCEEDGGLTRVGMIRVSAAGGALDPEPLRVAKHAGCQWTGPRLRGAQLVFDGQRFVAVWEEPVGSADSLDIHGVALSPDGAVSAPFAVSAEPGSERSPDIAALGGGVSLVVYSRFESDVEHKSRRVFARRLGPPASDTTDPRGLVAVGGCSCQAEGGAPPAPAVWTALLFLGLAMGRRAWSRPRRPAPARTRTAMLRALRRAPIAMGLTAVLGVAGCGDAPSPEAARDPASEGDGGSTWFEVGSGSTSFAALGPGATVELAEGDQGGYHLWLSIRCNACAPEGILSYGVDDASSGELLTFHGLQRWVRLREVEDGVRQEVGLSAFLNDGDPSLYLGRAVRLWATLSREGSREPPLEGEARAMVSD
jgi:MYXO-CTERM domain-containing protein